MAVQRQRGWASGRVRDAAADCVAARCCPRRHLHRARPALVIIGGETSQAGAALLDAARDALATAMTPLREHPVRVVAGTLGEQAQVLGAVTLVTQRMTLL
jgi:predicted NBD/HSP70 family sugar kinase